jgi:uracil-DNA glycosylase
MEPEIATLLKTIPEEWRMLILGDNASWPHLYCALRTLITIINQLSPTWENIFAFTRLVKLDTVKCVILGQDPYPNLQDATGYAFSSYCTTVPQSARVIFTRMHEAGILNVAPSHANLNSWAAQGVLSLNAALSCLIKKAGSHEVIWKPWMQGFVARLRAKFPHVPWILMGSKAKELYGADGLYTYHPSAEIYGTKYKFDATVFTRANERIVESGATAIDWNSINYTSRKISTWTDGSCIPNDSSPAARAGWAVVFDINSKPEYYMVGALALNPVPTNYRAEGTALFYAMREAYMYIVTGAHSKARPDASSDSTASNSGSPNSVSSNSGSPNSVSSNSGSPNSVSSNSGSPNSVALTILGEPELQFNPLGLPMVQINIDSKVWMENVTTHFPRWVNENKFAAKVAPDLTPLIWNMYLKLSTVARVVFAHVYSHTGVVLNELVDSLADKARVALEPGMETHEYF